MSSGIEFFPTNAKIAVGLSGGIDSTVAAAMLMERGFRVVAFHLIVRPEVHSLDEARSAADTLGIPLNVLDLSREFEDLVIRPFIATYREAETPNPCVLCNPAIKFGKLWEHAQALGAQALATGHYAALKRMGGQSEIGMFRPRDRHKDQTYFLCRLPRQALSRTIFPMSDLTKDEVRQRAAAIGLRPREESLEICFLGGENYRDFIRKRLGDLEPPPGDFVDVEGRVLGQHRGLINYTIGQRRGLRLVHRKPFYVLAMDPDNNRIIVGPKKYTRSAHLTVRDMVWSQDPPEQVFQAMVQIRNQHQPAEAEVRLLSPARVEVRFDQPQIAVTPGQVAAIYRDDLLLGGGWIERPTFCTPPPEPA